MDFIKLLCLLLVANKNPRSDKMMTLNEVNLLGQKRHQKIISFIYFLPVLIFIPKRMTWFLIAALIIEWDFVLRFGVCCFGIWIEYEILNWIFPDWTIKVVFYDFLDIFLVCFCHIFFNGTFLLDFFVLYIFRWYLGMIYFFLWNIACYIFYDIFLW